MTPMKVDTHIESTRKQVFRVVRRHASPVVCLETDNYPDAERYCWADTGPGELNIEKLWVPK